MARAQAAVSLGVKTGPLSATTDRFRRPRKPVELTSIRSRSVRIGCGFANDFLSFLIVETAARLKSFLAGLFETRRRSSWYWTNPRHRLSARRFRARDRRGNSPRCVRTIRLRLCFELSPAGDRIDEWLVARLCWRPASCPQGVAFPRCHDARFGRKQADLGSVFFFSSFFAFFCFFFLSHSSRSKSSFLSFFERCSHHSALAHEEQSLSPFHSIRRTTLVLFCRPCRRDPAEGESGGVACANAPGGNRQDPCFVSGWNISASGTARRRRVRQTSVAACQQHYAARPSAFLTQIAQIDVLFGARARLTVATLQRQVEILLLDFE